MATTVAQARTHLRQLESVRRAALRRRAERLEARVADAATLLRGRYGAAEVVLFGSLATGDLTGTVDVDLAVRGVETARYFDALAELMALFAAPVDLVRLEEASPSLSERIIAEGRTL